MQPAHPIEMLLQLGRSAPGSMVTRSLPPLARRTRISPIAKSRSFTRSWSASSSRSPLP